MQAFKLRVASARAPYLRAGLAFPAVAPGTIAVLVKPLADFTPAQLASIAADGALDVMVGNAATGWAALGELATEDKIELRFAVDAGRLDDEPPEPPEPPVLAQPPCPPAARDAAVIAAAAALAGKPDVPKPRGRGVTVKTVTIKLPATTAK